MELVLPDALVQVIEHVGEGVSLDEKFNGLLEKEIRRKLSAYRLIDRRFCRKYGMTLEEFEGNGMLEKSGYSFEAESDYHEWDAACDMIEASDTMENEQ